MQSDKYIKPGKEEISSSEKSMQAEISNTDVNSLTPNASTMWNLYAKGNIKVNNEVAEEKFVSALKNLEKMEIEQNQKKQQEQHQQNSIDKSGYYQLAKKNIENLYFSAGYTVDTMFDDEGKLSSSKFEIRQSGKQGRHVTPIGLIERIIHQALKPDFTVFQIIDALRLKIEVFKDDLDEKTNDDIQSVFDYFKHPQHLNTSGINRLIKILANFYHENCYLTFIDDYIKIPYKTHECYLVPTLAFGGSQYIHSGEGSFISALLKILDNFEKKIEANGKLADQEEHQLHYIIYAIFDFLPLPVGVKESKKLPNPLKHRYVNEPLERLQKAVIRHLLFVFEAYPLLHDKYGEAIKQTFFSYLAQGVSEEKLLTMLKEETLAVLATKLDRSSEVIEITVDYVKSAFTYAGNNKGFAQQYKTTPENFKALLEQEVNKQFLVKARVKENVATTFEVESTLQANIDSYAIDILYLGYISCLQSGQKYREFKHFQDLQINFNTFMEAFSPLYYNFIAKALSTDNINPHLPHSQLDKEIEKLRQTGGDIAKVKLLNQAIRAAIASAYEACCAAINKVTDKDVLKPYFNHLRQIRKTLQQATKLEQNADESQDTSDELFSLNDTTRTRSSSQSSTEESFHTLKSSSDEENESREIPDVSPIKKI